MQLQSMIQRFSKGLFSFFFRDFNPLTNLRFVYNWKLRLLWFVMLIGLFFLVTLKTSWPIVDARDALAELSGSPPVECYPTNATTTKLVVLVAELNKATKTFLEDRLIDELSKPDKTARSFVVCRTQYVIHDRNEAVKIGQLNNAAIVIWGRIDDMYQVRLEVTSHDSLGQEINLPSSQRDYSFQVKEPSRLSFLTQFIQSQILLMNEYASGQAGDYRPARDMLEQALEMARKDKLDLDNPLELAAAYTLLGQLYDEPYTNPPDYPKAIVAYTNAINMNPGAEIALFLRGQVFQTQDQDKTQKAYDDYTSIINLGSPQAARAYVNRASLQTDQRKAEPDLEEAIKLDKLLGLRERGKRRLKEWSAFPDAVVDYQEILKLENDKPENYSNLGLAQIEADDNKGATTTFQQGMNQFKSSDDKRKKLCDGLKNLPTQTRSMAHPRFDEESVSKIVIQIKEEVKC